MSENDGGPAFPSVGEGFGDHLYSAPGMTLRDWFAGQVFAQTFSDARGFGLLPEAEMAEQLVKAAAIAYCAADAMLKARTG